MAQHGHYEVVDQQLRHMNGGSIQKKIIDELCTVHHLNDQKKTPLGMN